MAKKASFDITTGVDLQEVDNAVNMARKEIATRYDFKGSTSTLEFDRTDATIRLDGDDAYKLQALMAVLREKLTRRKVPLKNIDEGDVEMGSLGRARMTVGLKQGIDQETAKKISKDVRNNGFKKVQISIHGDELRVTSGSRDSLQEVMAFVRGNDYGVELSFGNYR
ncbi:MAG: YajQ family cyclic di-GMP-binding protein [Gemmatimonadota bacterium]|nr:YajQ family cyclic di-GMP-binding protein [Gemmatimonadota bacterium]